MSSNHGSGKNFFRIVVGIRALMGIMLLAFVILTLTLNSSAAQESLLIHNTSDNTTIIENISNIESPGGMIRALTSTNIIQNPGFELGTTSWLFFTSGTGTFTTPSPGYEGTKAAKLALGSNGTNIQLYQTGVILESNTRYRLSFAAYSTTGHDIKVNLFKHGLPYTNYGLTQTFNLGNNWQTFSTEFTTKGFTGTVNDGRFQFWLAPFVTGVDTYYIDDVRLEKVSAGTVHNINKGKNYTTIQAAINDANPGDEIHVYNRTYYENVNVTKRLTLRGIGMPVVDAIYDESAITLAVNGIILERFTATGVENYKSSYSGILVISNNNTLIGNNAFSDFGWDGSGIYIGGNNNTLIDNNANSSSNGIYIDGNNNTLIHNNANSNYYGIHIGGDNNTLIRNNLDLNEFNGIFLISSNKNTLIGNNVSNSREIGILLYYSSNNTLLSNNASNHQTYGGTGISLYSSNDNIIISNHANVNFGCIDEYPCSGDGISLNSSSNNTLIGNNVSNNAIGISLSSSSDNKLSGNNALNNHYAPYGVSSGIGISLSSSGNNTLISNNANGNGAVGISFDSSSNNTLGGNNANSNNGDGISLDSSSNNTLSGNNANSNGGLYAYSGISLLRSSNNNMLIGNNVSNNGVGIYLLYSNNNNTLIGNNASNNGVGISLESAGNNKIYHNNLINNQASDDSNNNLWDNGYPSGGNYWSDYTGVDLKSGPGQNIPGSDGIGDTPYGINGGGGVHDRYPLMGQIANLIKNPGFESGKTNWTFYTSGTGTFTAVSPGYEGTKAAKLALGSSGSNIQLYQTGITLESNTRYRLSFTAYSMTGHDIKVNLFKHGSPYTNYGLTQTFNLGKNWQTFSTEFTTKGFTGTVNDGRFQFWLVPFVTGVDTYYIDDVRLELII